MSVGWDWGSVAVRVALKRIWAAAGEADMVATLDGGVSYQLGLVVFCNIMNVDGYFFCNLRVSSVLICCGFIFAVYTSAMRVLRLCSLQGEVIDRISTNTDTIGFY